MPLVGWYTTTSKYAIKVAYQTGNRVKLVWKILPNGDVFFGTASTCRAQLRRALNLVTGNPLIAHHIIPISLQLNPVVQKAFKSAEALHLNEALNGIPLSSAVHSGSHPHYSGLIETKLFEYNRDFPNATPSECYNFVTGIINDIRLAIANNPNTPINQLIF